MDLQIGSSSICSYTREHAIVDANYQVGPEDYGAFKRCMGMELHEKEVSYADVNGRNVYSIARGYQTPKLQQDALDVFYPISFFW